MGTSGASRLRWALLPLIACLVMSHLPGVSANDGWVAVTLELYPEKEADVVPLMAMVNTAKTPRDLINATIHDSGFTEALKEALPNMSLEFFTKLDYQVDVGVSDWSVSREEWATLKSDKPLGEQLKRLEVLKIVGGNRALGGPLDPAPIVAPAGARWNEYRDRASFETAGMGILRMRVRRAFSASPPKRYVTNELDSVLQRHPQQAHGRRSPPQRMMAKVGLYWRADGNHPDNLRAHVLINESTTPRTLVELFAGVAEQTSTGPPYTTWEEETRKEKLVELFSGGYALKQAGVTVRKAGDWHELPLRDDQWDEPIYAHLASDAGYRFPLALDGNWSRHADVLSAPHIGHPVIVYLTFRQGWFAWGTGLLANIGQMVRLA